MISEQYQRMADEIRAQSKYPDFLSITTEEAGRGFTFLHRVFRTNIDKGGPVIISTGDVYLQYDYFPGHKTFNEGLRLIEGSKKDPAYLSFMNAVNKFSLSQALVEAGIPDPMLPEVAKPNFKFSFDSIKNRLLGK